MMKPNQLTYRQQAYGPLRALSLENTAAQLIAVRFDRNPSSLVVRSLIDKTLAVLGRHEAARGVERVPPFHLRLRHGGRDLSLPLLDAALVGELLAGVPYGRALEARRERLFKDLLPDDPNVTFDLVRRYLAPLARVSTGRTPPESAALSSLLGPEAQRARADLAVLRRLCRIPAELCPPPDGIAEAPRAVVAELEPLLCSEGMSRETAAAFVAHLAHLRERFMPPRAELGAGQLMAIALDVRDRRSSRATAERQHVPVRLTLYTEDELAQLERLGPTDRSQTNELMARRIARLLTEAYCQGGLLSLGLVGLLTHTSSTRAGELVDGFELRHGIILPTPGTIHDAGSKLTHKVWIIELHLAGKQIGEIARETFHSEEAVGRYVDDFERVLLATAHQLPLAVMPRVLKIAPHVVEQYAALIAAKVGAPAAVRALLSSRGDAFQEGVA